MPGKILVSPVKVEETTGGFANVELGMSTPVKGIVVESGVSMFKKGDVLYFRRYSVDALTMKNADGGEETLHIVEEGDIVGYQSND